MRVCRLHVRRGIVGGVLLVLGLTLDGDVYQAQAPSGASAHWALDDGSPATTAADSSGNGNNATLNGPTWTSSGVMNAALIFDGNDSVTITNAATSLRPPTAYAISAWVRYSSTDSNGGEVVSMGDGYALRVMPDGKVKTYFYNGTTWDNAVTDDPNHVVNTKDGLWHHLVGQYDGSIQEIYVDGELAKSEPASGGITYPASNFFIGKHGNGGTIHDFIGTIDQVRIYTRALSAAEVSELAAEPEGVTYSHWRLDETAQTTAADSAGPNPAFVTGATWTADGKVNGALLFDGNDYAVVATPTESLKPTTAFAIAAWVRYSTTDTNGGEVASMGDGYALRLQPNGTVKTYFYDGTTWNNLVSNNVDNVNTKDGNWHHLVGQYTGSALQIYIDRQLVKEQAYSGPIAYPTSNGSFYLGKHGNGGTVHDFHGTLDEVRVYGRSLSQAEIDVIGDPGEDPASPVTFKVLTWNLQKGRGTDNVQNFNRQADHIALTGADVALLSAVVSQAHATALKNRLGGTWDVHWAANTSEGQAILSRFPISAKTSHPARMPEDCPTATEDQLIVKATVTIDERPISFFAVDQDHQESSARLCQAAVFSDWADDPANNFAEPRIVGGDFNAESESSITEWLATYNDGWSSATASNPDERQEYPGNVTGGGNANGRTRKSRIDHIMFSKGTAGLEVTLAKVYDFRDQTTSCQQVVTKIGNAPACTVCTSVAGDPTLANRCTYIDDTAVRPSDHIPVTVTFTLE